MRKKELLFLIGSITVFGFVFLLALAVGKYPISFANLVKMMFSTDGYDIERSIVVNLRLPRTIMAALTGVALSISGLLYQEVFKTNWYLPICSVFPLAQVWERQLPSCWDFLRSSSVDLRFVSELWQLL